VRTHKNASKKNHKAIASSIFIIDNMKQIKGEKLIHLALFLISKEKSSCSSSVI